MKRMVQQGFTLTELLIVMAITAIIAAVAYPSYVKQIQKTKRADARIALNDVAQRQERYFLLNRSYASTFTDLGYANNTPASPDGEYSLTLSNTTASTYTVNATGATGKGQAKDTQCKTLSLDQRGARSAVDSSGNSTTSSCW